MPEPTKPEPKKEEKPTKPERKQAPRKFPINELDLQFQLTNPEWGTQNINPELQAYLLELIDADESKPVEEWQYKDLWAMLSYYTRDFRLGNLSALSGELEYCRERLDFAGECLQMGAINSFLVTLREAISVTELSQSKGGFVRRRGGTITQEHLGNPLDTKPKGIFEKVGGKQSGGQ